jgi:hypothetical protein
MQYIDGLPAWVSAPGGQRAYPRGASKVRLSFFEANKYVCLTSKLSCASLHELAELAEPSSLMYKCPSSLPIAFPVSSHPRNIHFSSRLYRSHNQHRYITEAKFFRERSWCLCFHLLEVISRSVKFLSSLTTTQLTRLRLTPFSDQSVLFFFTSIFYNLLKSPATFGLGQPSSSLCLNRERQQQHRLDSFSFLNTTHLPTSTISLHAPQSSQSIWLTG